MKKSHEQWWKKTRDDVAGAVFKAVQSLDDVQSAEREAYLHHLRLYSNRQAAGFMGADYSPAASDGGARIRLNVVKSCIDTSVAHIATNRSRPLYQTSGGDFETKERARRLGKFMLGQFMHMKRYTKGLIIFRDGAIFGPGIEKFYHIGGRIMSERVYPHEIIHDHEEAVYGEVRQLFQHKAVDKGVLCDQFPKHWKTIEEAKLVRNDGGRIMQADQCSVIEAWHLASGRDADDGRHSICINSETLFDEEFERERFPFAMFNWSDPVRGMFGIGAAEELAPIQVEINYIAQKIQRLMTLATSYVWKEKGSGVGKLVNRDFAQYEYTGKPPVFQTVASVSAEYFNHLDRLYQRAFEIMGISQLSATSQKPAGLDSGTALRVYNDIGTKRFQHVGQRWEQFHLDAAECIYDVASDIMNSDDLEDVEVLVADDKDVEKINFSDVYLERDQYVTLPYPVSLLPDTPAGKLQTISELGQAVPAMAQYLPMLLNGIPDVQAVVDRMTSPIRIAEKMVDQILRENEYEPPFESMDLQVTRDIATRALLQGFVDGVPDERLMTLRKFIDATDELLRSQEQVMAPPMGGGVMPQLSNGGSPTLAQPPMPNMPPVAA